MLIRNALREERDALRQDLERSMETNQELVAEVEQTKDQRDDLWALISLIADALNVDREPHQTFDDRLVCAAKYATTHTEQESSDD